MASSESTGSERLLVKAAALSGTSPPITVVTRLLGTSSNDVYLGDDDGVLHAIDGESGEELWNWPTGGAIVSSPALGNGVVFTTSTDGTITTIGPNPNGE